MSQKGGRVRKNKENEKRFSYPPFSFCHFSLLFFIFFSFSCIPLFRLSLSFTPILRFSPFHRLPRIQRSEKERGERGGASSRSYWTRRHLGWRSWRACGRRGETCAGIAAPRYHITLLLLLPHDGVDRPVGRSVGRWPLRRHRISSRASRGASSVSPSCGINFKHTKASRNKKCILYYFILWPSQCVRVEARKTVHSSQKASAK